MLHPGLTFKNESKLKYRNIKTETLGTVVAGTKLKHICCSSFKVQQMYFDMGLMFSPVDLDSKLVFVHVEGNLEAEHSQSH